MTEAANGVEALTKLEGDSFDLLLTDRHMPVMDGPELLQALVAAGRAIPTVLCAGVLGSAVYDAFKRASGVGAGGDGFHVLGLANSRSSGELVKLDLLDEEAVEGCVKDFRPDCKFACTL